MTMGTNSLLARSADGNHQAVLEKLERETDREGRPIQAIINLYVINSSFISLARCLPHFKSRNSKWRRRPPIQATQPTSGTSGESPKICYLPGCGDVTKSARITPPKPPETRCRIQRSLPMNALYCLPTWSAAPSSISAWATHLPSNWSTAASARCGSPSRPKHDAWSKHTGDGPMAVFRDADSAADATSRSIRR